MHAYYSPGINRRAPRTCSRWAMALFAPIFAIIMLGTAMADERDDDKGEAYAIGLWGDLPYSAVQATVGVPNLIADMNAQPPVHGA